MATLFQFVAHNPLLRYTRTGLRKLPGGKAILRFVAGSMNDKYEQRFNDAMLAAVKPGMVVWDIGANVGLYTTEFLKLVGAGGKVIAVEPSPPSAQKVREVASASDTRLTVIQAALGRESGMAKFKLDAGDPTSVTNAVRADGNVEVEILRGDDLLTRLGETPDLIKIDVEGFECDVIAGMQGRLLRESTLRSMFVEIHSSQMAALGIASGGQQIEAWLKAAGFKVEWVDFSHIVATR